VADKGRVTVLTDPDRNRVANGRRAILTGLPNDLHQQDAIIPGPDGRLYLGSGSTCNACPQKSPRSAAILSFEPDGSKVRVVASGLRNPYGLAFDSAGALWATDNGRDEEKLDAPEELNRIVQGGRYGFPGCYGTRRGTGCAGTIAPVVNLEPHASADGLAFAPAGFAAGMEGDAFIAMWGTYYGTKHGRYLARVRLRGGKPVVSRFATGLDHPLAVLFDRDGALLVADWGTGIVWRIARRI
jgi:glucose/arabinose dehydrogenase